MLVIGVDEAGRGPLVGSVVAAAVAFPSGLLINGLTDSKKLSEKKRPSGGRFFGPSVTKINDFCFVLLFLARAAGKFCRFSVQNTIFQGSGSNFRDLKKIIFKIHPKRNFFS